MPAKFRHWFWLAVSTAILASAINLPVMGWLVPIGLIPYLYFVAAAKDNDLIFGTVFLGFVCMLSAYLWMLQVHPSNWTALSGNGAWLGQVGIWLIVAAIGTVAFWLLGWALAKLRPRLGSNWPLALIVLWPLMEFSRSLIASIGYDGPGGSIGPYWNFGHLAYSAAATPIVWAGRFTGLYGLTLLIVAINVAVFWLLSKRPGAGLAAASLAVMVIISLTAAKWPLVGQTSRVTMVHTSADTTDVDLASLKLPQSDLLVLPEESGFAQDQDGSLVARALKPGGTMVTSVSSQDQPPYNQLIFYNGQAIYSLQNKRFLIPTGEYVPYALIGIAKLINQTAWIEAFQRDHAIHQGQSAIKPVATPAGLVVGAEPCSGILAPQLHQNLARQGAQILINPASLHLLANASLYRRQSQQMARFLAVATARSFVLDSRGDESYALDPSGHKILSISGPTQAAQAGLPVVSTKTIYDNCGELFFELVAAIAVLAGIWLARPPLHRSLNKPLGANGTAESKPPRQRSKKA